MNSNQLPSLVYKRQRENEDSCNSSKKFCASSVGASSVGASSAIASSAIASSVGASSVGAAKRERDGDGDSGIYRATKKGPEGATLDWHEGSGYIEFIN